VFIAFYLIRQPSSSFINLESVTVFISCIGYGVCLITGLSILLYKSVSVNFKGRPVKWKRHKSTWINTSKL